MIATHWVLALLLFTAPAAASAAPSPEVVTLPGGVVARTKNATPAELATRDQLARLLATHDLGRWMATQEVLIAEGEIPHSHPVLTLGTRHLRDDELLLATFVHEQLHWFLGAREEAFGRARDDLRLLYPTVPVGWPDGAESAGSTYTHLIVCLLEIEAMQQLLGELRARQITEFWAHDHYQWIYRQVLTAPAPIAAIVRKHHLWVP